MISIVIVHYHVKKELFACLASIYASKPKSSFEIIVVDNDEKKTIEKELKKKFVNVRYIPNENKGFGQGNNVGARHAKGEYLFFLNPDTTFLNNTIDELVTFLNKHKDAAVVAPLLFDKNNKAYELQGLKRLTPLKAIFALSFIQKLFPQNALYKDYYVQNWDKKSLQAVDVIPGTAFVVRRKIFEKVKGFDEKFFLYFEEFDLCKRMRDLGKKIFITPQAKVFHAWGSSTKRAKRDTSVVFKQSRFYYFKKHFGFFQAFGTEAVLRFNKYGLLLTFFIALGAFLRLVNLEKAMDFIGDQGWYYLSARDMVMTGTIPLVGIASSHPWIHQGAYWTYMLGPVLWISQFNPLSGAILSGIIGLLSIFGMYKLGSVMFSRSVGVIAAGLFATAPLVVFSDRMPYHTSPIPFFTILMLYCLYQWIKGKIFYFPLIILFLAVMYNFELATFLMSIFIFALWLYGFITKKTWAKDIFHRKIWLMGIGLWFVAMLPMLLHDIQYGFPQTLKFLAWVGYRILVFLGYPPINPITPISLNHMGEFIIDGVQRLLFMPNGIIACFIFIAGVFVLLQHLFRKENKEAVGLILFSNIFLVVGLLIVKTPSEAYLPVLFPGILLMSAVLFSKLRVIGMIAVIGVIVMNSFAVVALTGSNFFFSQRHTIAATIVQEADGKEYNLKGQGPASEFESFTMNYEYLAWWLGNGPSKTEQRLRFVISEDQRGILVEKEVIDTK